MFSVVSGQNIVSDTLCKKSLFHGNHITSARWNAVLKIDKIQSIVI